VVEYGVSMVLNHLDFMNRRVVVKRMTPLILVRRSRRLGERALRLVAPALLVFSDVGLDVPDEDQTRIKMALIGVKMALISVEMA
jgi:hypothetical protein